MSNWGNWEAKEFKDVFQEMYEEAKKIESDLSFEEFYKREYFCSFQYDPVEEEEYRRVQNGYEENTSIRGSSREISYIDGRSW